MGGERTSAPDLIADCEDIGLAFGMWRKSFPSMALYALCISGATDGKAMASEEGVPISYGCNEVVVIGRVKTIGFTDQTSSNDVLGHGRFDMQVSIKRVLRGTEARGLVPASGYGHGQMRADVDFWMVLTPVRSGGYIVRTGNIVAVPYVLASRCTGVR